MLQAQELFKQPLLWILLLALIVVNVCGLFFYIKRINFQIGYCFIYRVAYLLLIFSLRSQSRFNALSSFDECFSLCLFTRPMREYACQICAYQCYHCAANLFHPTHAYTQIHSIVNNTWMHSKLKQVYEHTDENYKLAS